MGIQVSMDDEIIITSYGIGGKENAFSKKGEFNIDINHLTIYSRCGHMSLAVVAGYAA